VKRRDFLKSGLAIAALPSLDPGPGAGAAPTIAFTFDDPTTNGGAGLSSYELNGRILAALARHRLRSVLFVCGMRVDSDAGTSLVKSWDRGGHLIGNHSYSHLYFHATAHAVELADFEKDALRNEPLIRGYAHFSRLFRYPFFKEGNTVEKRDGMRSFLQEHGYRIGRATIDASDWAIDARLRKRASDDPGATFAPYRDFLLEHIWARARFYDSLAGRVLGRPVRHTLLLHHSALNALFLDDLIQMFVSKGWKPVDAEWAYADPAYDSQPKILPAGESLIWALAKETGAYEAELRYPGEDDVYENPRMDALKL
jgi:peptidoglycan/xylan/chitin deacetylase (PgdA/CDA1 family)